MRYFCVLLLLVVAACQTPMPFEPESDPCKSLQYLSLVGTKLEETGRDRFPLGTRFIMPDTAVTEDFQSDRLNVHVNRSGRIENIKCG